MKKRLTLLIVLLSSIGLGVSVNRVNGGIHVTYVDFKVPGGLIPLELSRSYNSVTALNEKTGWNGVFGWGWTSDFESILTVTPERQVILRDGQTGNTVIFRSRRKDPSVQQTFFESVKEAYFNRKKGRKLSKRELKGLSLPPKLIGRLKTDSKFRVQIAIQYGLKGEIPKGQKLVSTQFGYQTVEYTGKQWVRRKGSNIQYYDQEGRLSRQEDRNGFYADYKYSKKNPLQLDEIVARNKVASLKFKWRNGRVSEVTDNKGRKAIYYYDKNGNLIKVIDSVGQTFKFRYENNRFNHLLTKIEYPSEGGLFAKPYRELRYDSTGLIVFHRKKDGEQVSYSYGKKPTDPRNNFWTKTTVSKKKDPRLPDESYEEFFLKKRPDGSKYLYKQETRETYRFGARKKVSAETILFTACCGTPLQIIRDGVVTKFKYYSNGLLRSKIGPNESVELKYEPRFSKVTKVIQNGLTSDYKYDSIGNLVTARNSAKKRVSLKYDSDQRVRQMVDEKGQVISFQYGNLNKPVIIDMRGVGTIRIAYHPTGKIRSTETVIVGKRRPSAAESKNVIRRVMGSFRNLLGIIRPAAEVNRATPLKWRRTDR